MENVNKDVSIDLSKQGLKQVKQVWSNSELVEELILDDNDITNIENLNELCNLQQLSASKNKIRRMSCLPPFLNLCSLDLSNNAIVCIEGLKSIKTLKQLNLSGNHIKIIDHLNENLALEYLDLSDNAIGHVNDISYLIKLKELYLHKNHISHLRHCDKYLPDSLEVLTLHENNIPDLAEVSHLEKLPSLMHLTFKNNPCLSLASTKPGFNYRPYLKMWCLNLKIVDNSPLDPLEALKAEWLYSQGRGRRFRPGEHDSLLSFLTTTCPVTAKTISAEEDRKLLLILSKAEQYKQQLKEQGDASNPQNSPTRMVSSYHDVVSRHSARASPEVMSRSLDCAALRNSPPSSHKTTPNTSARGGTPLQAASTLVPVPESLVSPDVCRPLHPLVPQTNRNIRSPLATPVKNCSPHSTPGSRRRTQPRMSPNNSPKSTPTKIGVRKPRTNENIAPGEKNENAAQRHINIDHKASQKHHKQGHDASATATSINRCVEKKVKLNASGADGANSNVWRAALCIQRRWRGYRARCRDPTVTEACRSLQAARMQEYIMKVAEDMEATKVALEGNRKLQVLQMKAIDAVWKKLAGSDVEGLAASCLNLTRQVEELRTLVQLLQVNGHPPVVPTGTQTDIVAVRTPKGDASFPIPLHRPSHLNLSDSCPEGDGQTNYSEDVCWTPACQEGKDLQALRSTLEPEPPLSPTPSLD